MLEYRVRILHTSCREQESTAHRQNIATREPPLGQRNIRGAAEAERPFSNPRDADTLTKKELVAAAGGTVLWGPDPSRAPSDDWA
jgi:hypothetical protein